MCVYRDVVWHVLRARVHESTHRRTHGTSGTHDCYVDLFWRAFGLHLCESCHTHVWVMSCIRWVMWHMCWDMSRLLCWPFQMSTSAEHVWVMSRTNWVMSWMVYRWRSHVTTHVDLFWRSIWSARVCELCHAYDESCHAYCETCHVMHGL